MVLGGGILAPGEASCSTEQRAFAARGIFEALARRPLIVLSGRGPREPSRPLDPVEGACIAARLRQELAAPRLATTSRTLVARELHELVASDTAPLIEADYMCAVILETYAADDRDATLARMRFEARSESTIDNATLSTPILASENVSRALLVSTPVVAASGAVTDNHPARALEDFRAARREGRHHYRLGAAGCPFEGGGPSWVEFE